MHAATSSRSTTSRDQRRAINWWETHRPRSMAAGRSRSSLDAPYRTRLLVVRPRDADPVQRHRRRDLAERLRRVRDRRTVERRGLYQGYAWVGVSAAGGRDLRVPRRGWNGSRAGAGGRWSSTTPNGTDRSIIPAIPASFDIFTQAGRAVAPGRDRHRRPAGRAFRANALIAAGGSQSAMRLVAYLNAFHPRRRGVRRLSPVGVGRAGASTRRRTDARLGVRTAIRTDTRTHR